MASPSADGQFPPNLNPCTEWTKSPLPEKNNNVPTESKYFSINVSKNRTISINKPLIPLKLTLFTYYGAGSFMPSFITIIYKQRGISLSDLATMTIIAPAFQFLGTTLSGIIADKIGRAKPVLVANLLLYLSVVMGIILLPKIDSAISESRHLNVTCYDENEIRIQTQCGEVENNIVVQSCYGYCSGEFDDQCLENDNDCHTFGYYQDNASVPLTIHINGSSSEQAESICEYNVNSISFENKTISWCIAQYQKYCIVSCTVQSGIKPSKDEYRQINSLFIAYIALYVLFLTTYSNCYRCLDVTCMFLVKEHDSSFGHERFFAMLGNVLISPIAGIIADLATPEGGERNYTAAFYLAVGMNLFLFFIIYKLPVRVNSPGEKMWKKSFNLLKNPDAIMFLFIILVLGTAWNFGKYFLFWFLEEMNASTVLVGLIPSVGALYGLPFLLTAHWWVKNIGSTRIFVLALLSYVVNSAGYSFLQDPWYSLALEGTGILSYYLLWVAVMEYSHDLAPDGLRATVISTSGAIHFSIGKATSGLMGRFIMNSYGGRAAFRFMAVLCLVVAFLYSLYRFVRSRCCNVKHKLKLQGFANEKWKSQEIYTVKRSNPNYAK